MQVEYGKTPIIVPYNAINTEITTYMWPGFLGEFDHTALTFTAWELVGPTRWLPRPDIVAPPLHCIGSETVLTRIWNQGSQQWSQQGSLWRLQQPPV